MFVEQLRRMNSQAEFRRLELMILEFIIGKRNCSWSRNKRRGRRLKNTKWPWETEKRKSKWIILDSPDHGSCWMHGQWRRAVLGLNLCLTSPSCATLAFSKIEIQLLSQVAVRRIQCNKFCRVFRVPGL